MFKKLTDVKKGLLFCVLVLLISLFFGIYMPAAELPNQISPMFVALIMMLVITREGYTKAGWKTLGIHKLGLRTWLFALLAPLVILAIGYVIVLGLGTAKLIEPADATWMGFIINMFLMIAAVTILSLGEEFGWRGYLFPRLYKLGRVKTSIIIGLVWAAWHYPILLLTDTYHPGGNRLVVLLLFTLIIVSASFIYNELRMITGSIWPACLLHASLNIGYNNLQTLLDGKQSSIELIAGETGITTVIIVGFAAIWIIKNRKPYAQV
ncbi:CPBP family intramembrane metalloprotease [Paenibacillus psychroresistens]|uniref:CPBP family intramembrane metalloprotease n=1 Tax=Paenibacillus psychroresistens TaxID=1778678 RepID=A0A6B8RLN2_9BACL|nr:CPBP family intramembrane glutamic endopeptidase [Paenibacillus psychroresistens]QGQ96552.1 CPBP family intramembrane metalloprotease [Paenibacillus psychroresistens]